MDEKVIVYESEGTVGYEIGGPTPIVCFVPVPDYCVKHKGKCYAVFVGTNGGVVSMKLKDKVAELSPSSWPRVRVAIMAAAAAQAKVRVGVTATGANQTPELARIRVTPA